MMDVGKVHRMGLPPRGDDLCAQAGDACELFMSKQKFAGQADPDTMFDALSMAAWIIAGMAKSRDEAETMLAEAIHVLSYVTVNAAIDRIPAVTLEAAQPMGRA